MDKNEFKTRLIIAQGELKSEIDNEFGCFDEIAQRIFLLAFSCEDLLDKSSEDVLIQFDTSVRWEALREFVDGIYLSQTKTCVNFTTSDMYDINEIYSCSLERVDRNVILDVVKELIKMCEK